MSTRSGVTYKRVEIMDERDSNDDTGTGTDEAAGEPTVLALLQEMLRDRQQREAELAEERRLREAERREREEALRREQARRDEEASKREAEAQQQLAVLQDLVRGIQKQSEATAKKLSSEQEVKVAKLTEEDDVEAYLTTFERLMKVHAVPESRWAYKLAPQLVGKAQQAYAAMGADDSGDYLKLKEAILRRYDINEKTIGNIFEQWPGRMERATESYWLG